jgi:hypothetical protein
MAVEVSGCAATVVVAAATMILLLIYDGGRLTKMIRRRDEK